MGLRAAPGQGAGDSVKLPVCTESKSLIFRGEIEREEFTADSGRPVAGKLSPFVAG